MLLNVRYKIVSIAVSQIIGTALAIWVSKLFSFIIPSYISTLSGALFLVVAFMFIYFKPNIKTLYILIMLFASMFRCLVNMSFLENSHTGWGYDRVTVKGRVLDTVGIGFNPNEKIVIDVIDIEGNPICGKMLIENIRDAQKQQKPLKYGDIAAFTGRIDIPEGKSNPGGIDYRLYLWMKNISSTLFAEKAEQTGLSSKSSIMILAISIRDKLSAAIDKFTGDIEAMLLKRILISEKGIEDEKAWKTIEYNFREAGLSHVLAVSGSHINMIIIPLCFMLVKLGVKRKFANPVIILILLMYLPIVGFSPSASRAIISTSITLIGQLVLKDSDLPTSLALASGILLFLRPMYLVDPGFQLSFTAALSIFLYYSVNKRFLLKIGLPDKYAGFAALPLSVQIGITPISIYWFGRVSLVSVPVNMLAYPFIALLMASGFIASLIHLISPAIGNICGIAANMSAKLLIQLTNIISGLSFASINIGSSGIFILLLTIITILCLYLISGKRLSQKIAILFISVILPFVLTGVHNYFENRKFTVTFLDVGHGDSIFINTPNGKSILIDAGTKGKGLSVLLPYLAYRGINKIDIAIITHLHEDHFGGLAEINEIIEIETICIPCVGAIVETGVNLQDAIRLSKGNRIYPDKDIALTVLSPSEGLEGVSYMENANNTSLVIMLMYNDINILFTGDAEIEIENIITADIASMGGANVLKVAHHGSDTSSSDSLIEVVNPSIAILSTGKGYKSNYSFKVRERLEDSGAVIYSTAENGAIMIISNGDKIEVKTMK